MNTFISENDKIFLFRIFNFYIFLMHEQGVLGQIQNRYYKDDQIINCDIQGPRRVGLINVVSLGIILSVGLIFSFCVFLFELCFIK